MIEITPLEITSEERAEYLPIDALHLQHPHMMRDAGLTVIGYVMAALTVGAVIATLWAAYAVTM